MRKINLAKNKNKGSLLLESILIVNIFVIFSITALELCRRSQLEPIMSYVSCCFARSRALGKSHWESKRSARKQIEKFFSKREARALLRGIKEGVDAKQGRWVKIHSRFRGLISFPGKHHFEMTKQCRF